MTDNGICSLLGLAMRAGRLAAGDEPVRELARDGVIRAVFLAQDAGAAVSRQAAFTVEKAHAPLLTLPVTKEVLGGALGRRTCAMCAVSDSGFAAKAAEKLAALDPAFREAAEALQERHARIQSRRGIKKHRDKAAQDEAPDKQKRSGHPPRPPARQEPGKRRANAAKPQQRPAGRKHPDGDGTAQRRGTAGRQARGPDSRRRRQTDNNQPLADKRPTGPRVRRAPAIEHPGKLRR